MKIAILGYGMEGQAAYRYYSSAGHDITICDQNESIEVPADATTKLGPSYLDDLDGYDTVVRSPFVHPRKIIEANSADILNKVTSNTNEFLRVCPTPNIIGVTGTKGKGTTSTLIAKMLQAAGKTVHLGGNIGVAAMDLLDAQIQSDDWVVLELSSFQLIDLQTAPHIAICLMVASEHLDWHEDFEEYVAAKQQLFIKQNESDIAIYYAGNETSVSIADASEGQLIPYFEAPGAYVDNDQILIEGKAICRTDELQLLGHHNWQNACAAVTAVWQIIQDVNAIRSVLATFSGLEHRLTLVRELDGVRYYDDSFGTTPETAVVAMEAFDAPKVMIFGGSDKGASYDELAKAVAANNVKSVLLIGNQAAKIKTALDNVSYTAYQHGGHSMDTIVDAAHTIAEPGDVVLLSTGCASFDMFQNYKDRGAQFTRCVLDL